MEKFIDELMNSETIYLTTYQLDQKLKFINDNISSKARFNELKSLIFDDTKIYSAFQKNLDQKNLKNVVTMNEFGKSK